MVGRTLVFLTGFLSAGKSTVGKRLAERLGIPFFDLDSLVETRLGRSVEEILIEHGEVFYRALEAEILRALCSQAFGVVALGAGTVTHPENRKLVREHGLIIHLVASSEELWRRTAEGERWPRLWLPSASQEPLPGTGPLRERLESLLEWRTPYYEFADITVDTTGMDVDEVVEEILGQLRSHELFDAVRGRH
jgi:shikimate kinase